MEQNAFDSRSVLGDGLYRMSRLELALLAEALCAALSEEQGYHGGVRPSNISVTGGTAALGERARTNSRDWGTEELEFMAPEVFWSGELAPSADVYSIGLLLYAGVSGGMLPFYPTDREPAPNDRAAALRRRMNGDSLRIPKAAGRKLAVIIRRATQYRPEDRYQTPAELAEALAVYRAEQKAEAPSAEEMFEKPEQELSDVESMMLEIIAEDTEPAEAPPEAAAEEAPQEAPEAEEEPQPEDVPEAAEDVPEETSEAPEDVPEAPEEAPEQPEAEPAPEPLDFEEPLLEQKVKPAPKPKKRPRHKAKKNSHKSGILAALSICAVVLLVLLLRAVGVFDGGAPAPDPSPSPSPVTTPEPSPAPAPDPEPEPSPEPEPPKESTYEVIVSDASWEAAAAAAKEKGGHLVVFDSEEEYIRVAGLANEKGAAYVWIGLSRAEGGELAWVQPTETPFYRWADGEPSVKDTNGTPEDYVLLGVRDGTWVMNDCGNDPAGSYPRFYRGRMAYVIEYEP